jgi:hypothetical protein
MIDAAVFAEIGSMAPQPAAARTATATAAMVWRSLCTVRQTG